MRCFMIVFIVEFILCNNGGYGMLLPWDIRQGRKLLEQGPPILEKDRTLFTVITLKGNLTGIVMGQTEHLGYVPLPLVVERGWHPKITVELERRSQNGGWSFWNYYKDVVENISWVGHLYTGSTPPTGQCEIYGAVHNVSVNIESSKDNAINVKAISGKICFTEVGGALFCTGKLVGLVHHVVMKNESEEKKPNVQVEENNSTNAEESTAGTVAVTDKIEEASPEKQRKKRDDEEEKKDEVKEEVKEGEKEGEKKEEKEGEKKEEKEGEKEGKKKKDKKKKTEREEEGECSNLCEVTPMQFIKELPRPPPKQPAKKQENVIETPAPTVHPRKSGATAIIANIDLLPILLFSSIFLLF